MFRNLLNEITTAETKVAFTNAKPEDFVVVEVLAESNGLYQSLALGLNSLTLENYTADNIAAEMQKYGDLKLKDGDLKLFCKDKSINIHIIEITENDTIIHHFYDSAGTYKELTGYDPKDYHDPQTLHMASYKGQYNPVVSKKFLNGLTSSYVSTNTETQPEADYEIIPSPKDGDCGYTAIGVLRKEAHNIILKNLANPLADPQVKKYLSHGVIDTFYTNNGFFNYLVKKLYKPGLLDQIRANIIKMRNSATNKKDAGEEYDAAWKALQQEVSEEELLQHYVNYDIDQKQVQCGWVHPTTLLALAAIAQRNLYIWMLNEKKKRVPYGQFNQHLSGNSNEEIHILFSNLNHFDRIKLKQSSKNNSIEGEKTMIPAESAAKKMDTDSSHKDRPSVAGTTTVRMGDAINAHQKLIEPSADELKKLIPALKDIYQLVKNDKQLQPKELQQKFERFFNPNNGIDNKYKAFYEAVGKALPANTSASLKDYFEQTDISEGFSASRLESIADQLETFNSTYKNTPFKDLKDLINNYRNLRVLSDNIKSIIDNGANENPKQAEEVKQIIKTIVAKANINNAGILYTVEQNHDYYFPGWVAAYDALKKSHEAEANRLMQKLENAVKAYKGKTVSAAPEADELKNIFTDAVKQEQPTYVPNQTAKARNEEGETEDLSDDISDGEQLLASFNATGPGLNKKKVHRDDKPVIFLDGKQADYPKGTQQSGPKFFQKEPLRKLNKGAGAPLERPQPPPISPDMFDSGKPTSPTSDIKIHPSGQGNGAMSYYGAIGSSPMKNKHNHRHYHRHNVFVQEPIRKSVGKWAILTGVALGVIIGLATAAVVGFLGMVVFGMGSNFLAALLVAAAVGVVAGLLVGALAGIASGLAAHKVLEHVAAKEPAQATVETKTIRSYWQNDESTDNDASDDEQSEQPSSAHEPARITYKR